MRWWCGAAPQPLRRWPQWRNARRWPSNDASGRGVALMRYDVIVIAAGSGGVVWASRLSEDPRTSVLLLEAGPDYPTFAHLPDDLKLGNNVWLSAYGPHNWGYVAQLTPQQNRLTIPRGKVTGGSSAVNGQGLYRGLPGGYDNWAAWGKTGGSYEEVLPEFCTMGKDHGCGRGVY